MTNPLHDLSYRKALNHLCYLMEHGKRRCTCPRERVDDYSRIGLGDCGHCDSIRKAQETVTFFREKVR